MIADSKNKSEIKKSIGKTKFSMDLEEIQSFSYQEKNFIMFDLFMKHNQINRLPGFSMGIPFRQRGQASGE